MIVKMIQNIDMIKKMQESFNKDLEEIKMSQYIMNNAINEIKNTGGNQQNNGGIR